MMTKKKWSLLWHGMINLGIHLPALFVAAFFGGVVYWCLDLVKISTNSFVDIVLCLPLLIPFVSCIAEIIRGAKLFRRERVAIFCFVSSLVGVFLYIGTLALCVWLSRY